MRFFAVTALIGRFMKDVNTRRRIFLSLSKLGCGLQKINSRIFELHLTFKVSWNNRDVCKKREFSFNSDVSLPSPSSLLKLPNRELKQQRRQRQRKRHPKIYPLYFICATLRLFQLVQLLQKWQTIQEPNW